MIFNQLLKGQLNTLMTAALTKLKSEVAATKTAIASAVVFIKGLKDKLDAALAGGNLESDIQALSADLDASQADLAAAIATDPGTVPPPPGTLPPPVV